MTDCKRRPPTSPSRKPRGPWPACAKWCCAATSSGGFSARTFTIAEVYDAIDRSWPAGDRPLIGSYGSVEEHHAAMVFETVSIHPFRREHPDYSRSSISNFRWRYPSIRPSSRPSKTGQEREPLYSASITVLFPTEPAGEDEAAGIRDSWDFGAAPPHQRAEYTTAAAASQPAA
jgi:hypothetical protein